YRRKAINELASVGITLPSQYWASAYGYKPHMFQRALEEAHYGNFQDVLTPLANMYQTNGAQTREAENGRPKEDVTEQSDSASRSQDYN
ncbi:MAG: hypothetical protein VZQ58_06680, partial [Bacteroidales bacterium]|nr:hypothetical protein [Bacteroidales bacterium]